MPKKPLQVFLDANVVIQAGKPPGGPVLARFADLVTGGFVTVLTTDLTKTEVAKKHAKNDHETIKDLGRTHFRKVVKDVTGVELPTVTKAELYEKLLKKYESETEKMFASLGSKTLSIDTVKPSIIFQSYATETGFFSAESKKDQFPDAFIFACLKTGASAKDPIVIVSDDGDFVAPSAGEKHISVLKSIPDLFKQLGLQVDAPEVETFLETHHGEALKLVGTELNDWGLQVSDVEDAEIDEITVTDIEFVELTSFSSAEAGDDILVIGRVKIKADVSYTHPDWDHAMYDSEDKVLIPFEDISGETEIAIEAEFSMSISVDEGGEPEEIQEVRFTSDKFIWVELHPYDPYEYR